MSKSYAEDSAETSQAWQQGGTRHGHPQATGTGAMGMAHNDGACSPSLVHILPAGKGGYLVLFRDIAAAGFRHAEAYAARRVPRSSTPLFSQRSSM